MPIVALCRNISDNALDKVLYFLVHIIYELFGSNEQEKLKESRKTT